MKDLPKVVEAILEALKEARTVCVVGHIRPDGDCIGSQLGLALALEAAGKEVTIWNQDSVPPKLRFLDPDRRFRKPASGHRFDVVVATDCAALDRMGRVADHIEAPSSTLITMLRTRSTRISTGSHPANLRREN